jgi:hypothetical protein
MKTHFAVKVAFSTEVVASCGRGKRLSENPFDVTCELCKSRDAHILALDEAKSERERKFWLQEPRTVRNPWTGDDLTCSACGGNLFRSRGRDLFTYWYQCANVSCEKKQGYPTETGMST